MTNTLRSFTIYVAILAGFFCLFTPAINAQTISTYGNATFNNPQGVTFDPSGNLYVANVNDNTVSKITPSGSVSTYVSGGISSPNRIIFDKQGNLYVANYFSNSVSIVTPGGNVSTFVPYISSPSGFAFDSIGNLYISSFSTNKIIKVTPNGILSTYVNGGLNAPQCLAFDASGNLYVANFLGNYITKVSPNKIISTYVSSTSGLNAPVGIVFDDANNLFVTNYGGNNISKVNPSGIVSTLVNTGLSGPYCLTIDATNNLYVSNNKFSIISKISTNNPLPVSISSFSAIRNNKSINLNWHTTTEQNTNHFNIQRSTTSNNFQNIGLLEAKSSGSNDYSFVDNKPLNGINCYRLQTIDKDGNSSYSKVISINYTAEESISLSPNPAKDFTTIHFSKQENKITKITVYDLSGKEVITLPINNSEITQFKLNTQVLKSGLYVVRVQTTNGSLEEKLVIDK